MRFKLAVLLCLTSLKAGATPDPLVITNDPGGYILPRAEQVKQIISSGQRVIIDGSCNSTCTMYLRLPAEQICVTRRSSLGFHQASLEFDPARKAEDQTAMLMLLYPPAVQEWIAEQGGLTPKLLVLRGRELAKRVPICEGH